MSSHRYTETINGQKYRIEADRVQPDRWRACLVPRTEGPTALMPFYGRTPEEAAQQLARWLVRIHGAAA